MQRWPSEHEDGWFEEDYSKDVALEHAAQLDHRLPRDIRNAMNAALYQPEPEDYTD